MKVRTMVTMGATVLALAACGSAGASPAASSSPSGGQGQLNRRGAAGEVVQVSGATLVLSGQDGDTSVQTSPTTTVQRTSTGTVADIVPGSCIFAVGTRDATGTITAAMVGVSNAVNGSCPAGRFGPGGPGGQGALRTPNPNRTPNPGRGFCSGQPNCAATGGLVTAVRGTSVTVQPPSGAPQTIMVPTTVRVARTLQASLTDLAVGQCVRAVGSRSSSGTVQATNLTIVPAGPSGCFTGGGFGGFGGRGRGSAGGGGGGPGG